MTSTQQNEELKRRIWQIANDVRGTVDGWDFKQYVLGALFYRFISENFSRYIEGGDESIEYAQLDDDVITDEIKDDAIKTKGYFIYPSQLFENVVARANENENLNTDLKAIFSSIQNSALGYASEEDIKGLFDDFDTTSNRLGSTVKDKNARLAKVLKGVDELDFGHFEDSQIDLFGDAYEFLIGNYAANAGKSGGEFFTPQHVSKLIAQLAIHGQQSVNKVYDPATGSGSLLLQAKKLLPEHLIEEGFFGQEINHTTYNLARMNMFLHNVNYDKFNIQLGNTLTEPHFRESKGKGFDAIVSNPPYSVKWIGSDDPTLINDERFAPAGVLAPKSKADFAFVLHALNFLSPNGRAALVCFPGILYRGGAEQKIRQYLVDNNYIETVISLAPNLFYGTTIAVNILVLSKHKPDTNVQFIDASGEDFFKKVTNNNVMTDDHVAAIVKLFEDKMEVQHVAKYVRMEAIAENEYNLSVSSYVKAKNTREVVRINDLNQGITKSVAKIERLREEIEEIVSKLSAGGHNMKSIDMDELLSDTSVEWLPLKDIATITIGEFVHKRLQDPKAEYPVFNGGRTPTGYYEKFNNAGNKILISARGYAGYVNRISKPYWAGNSCYSIGIIDEETVNWNYVYHYLKSNERILMDSQQKGGIPAVSKKQVEALQVPIPCPDNPRLSLSVQAEIVRILDTLDGLTNELIAELAVEQRSRELQYEHYRDLLLNFPNSPQEVDA